MNVYGLKFVCETCQERIAIDDIGSISDEMIQCVNCYDAHPISYAYEMRRIQEVEIPSFA